MFHLLVPLIEIELFFCFEVELTIQPFDKQPLDNGTSRIVESNLNVFFQIFQFNGKGNSEMTALHHPAFIA